MAKNRRAKVLNSILTRWKEIRRSVEDGTAEQKYLNGTFLRECNQIIAFYEASLANLEPGRPDHRAYECQACGRVKVIPCDVEAIKCSDCSAVMVSVTGMAF